MRKLCIPLCILFWLNTLWALRPGETAPEWTLEDLDGKVHKRSDYNGKIVVMEWFNYDCPFVQKHYSTGSMQKQHSKWMGRNVVWLCIRSGESDQNTIRGEAKKLLVKPTGILHDPGSKVATLFNARTTPHVFIISPSGKLAYSGAVDDQPTPDPASLEGAQNYVAEALDALLAGKPVQVQVTRPYGCGVK
jgi:peroxiredoxin